VSSCAVRQARHSQNESRHDEPSGIWAIEVMFVSSVPITKIRLWKKAGKFVIGDRERSYTLHLFYDLCYLESLPPGKLEFQELKLRHVASPEERKKPPKNDSDATESPYNNVQLRHVPRRENSTEHPAPESVSILRLSSENLERNPSKSGEGGQKWS